MAKRKITRAQATEKGLTRYFTGEPCPQGHIAERETGSGGCCQCLLEYKREKREAREGYRSRAEIDAVRESSTRVCNACNRTLPQTDEFFVVLKNKAKKWTGFSAECRECRNKRFGPYYKKNRRKLIARARKHVKRSRATPEGKEKNRKWAREGKRRQLADPSKRKKHNEYGRRWRKNNPERAKLFKHAQPHMKRMRAMLRRAAELRATSPWLTAEHKRQIETIYAIADYLTRKTGMKYEVDHYYPLLGRSSRGLHVPWNMRVIPAVDNRVKGNGIPIA